MPVVRLRSSATFPVMQFLFTQLVHYCRLGSQDPPTVLAVLRDTEDRIERAMIEERAAAEGGGHVGASGGDGSVGLQSRQLEVSPGKMVLRSGGGWSGLADKGVELGQREQSRGRTISAGGVGRSGRAGSTKIQKRKGEFHMPTKRGIFD
jgi:hypothetical protein